MSKMSKSLPSPNGSNGSSGRDSGGKFTKGNAGGPGNPHAQRVSQIRSVLLDAVSDNDIKAIVKALVAQAKEGDVKAAAELFNRLIGRAGDAPVQGELSSPDTAPLATTPEQILEAIEKRKAEPRDSKRGLRISNRGGLRPTGGDPGSIAG